jgi:integrative and conjugative element protein (TIGR02256 family)
MTRLRFARPGGGVFEFSANALAVIDAYRQLRPEATEAGGILLGRMILESQDIVIDEATLPSAPDRRKRFSFFRARQPAQKLVERAWGKSDRTQNYLGEWHTHPEDYPSPSALDLKNWKKILRRSVFEQGSLFFVIGGRRAVGTWEGTKTRGDVISLPLIGGS